MSKGKDLFEIIEDVLDLIEIDNKEKGKIKCPVCDKIIGYRKFKENRHVIAVCETNNCVSFRS